MSATKEKTFADLCANMDVQAVGDKTYEFIGDLYPICRSITGNGLRETLRQIEGRIPLEIQEVPSGTGVFDWTVPKEWNIREAWIKGPDGKKVVDFADHTLHVLNYSVPVREKLPLSQLRERIFTNPDRPEDIPYRTSYFKENWGFCMAHNKAEALAGGEYEVYVDSTLEDGSLSYGECVLPGDTEDEIFFSSHVCHPSLANDNLSGAALAVALAEALQGVRRRYTYRFVFAPGTIGAITWLAQNEAVAARIANGLILACVGDRKKTVYKQSRPGALVDRAAAHVLQHLDPEHEIQPFSPYGYDERQYGSPGFNLPVGCFMKSPPGKFPEYHSSADNLDLVKPEHLADSFAKILAILHVLERDAYYINRNPKCEPMLGKRGLYGSVGGTERKAAELALLWVLNYADGCHSLLDTAELAGMPFAAVREAADMLENAGLLERALDSSK